MSLASDLPASLFLNPVLHALRSDHAHFAFTAGLACRYPADVAPWAALAEPTTAAMHALATLLTPGESVWLIEPNPPAVAELNRTATVECMQMALPHTIAPPPLTTEPTPLTAADAADMLALINLAFPGYYRPRTREMGAYHGIRTPDGTLAAMGGERLMLRGGTQSGYSEISGVCTHPTHRAHGYASSIMSRLIRDQRAEGRVSWLHVLTTNAYPIALYRSMGFETIRTVTLHRYALTT